MKRLLCMLVLLAAVIPAMAQKTSSRKVVYGGNASIGVNCGVSKDINSNSVSATISLHSFLAVSEEKWLHWMLTVPE